MENIGLKTVCFRAGCITGPNHSGAKLRGFIFSYKNFVNKTEYTLIGYKGKQMRTTS